MLVKDSGSHVFIVLGILLFLLLLFFYGAWAFGIGQDSACRYLFGENYEFNLTECKVTE